MRSFKIPCHSKPCNISGELLVHLYEKCSFFEWLNLIWTPKMSVLKFVFSSWVSLKISLLFLIFLYTIINSQLNEQVFLEFVWKVLEKNRELIFFKKTSEKDAKFPWKFIAKPKKRLQDFVESSKKNFSRKIASFTEHFKKGGSKLLRNVPSKTL